MSCIVVVGPPFSSSSLFLLTSEPGLFSSLPFHDLRNLRVFLEHVTTLLLLHPRPGGCVPLIPAIVSPRGYSCRRILVHRSWCVTRLHAFGLRLSLQCFRRNRHQGGKLHECRRAHEDHYHSARRAVLLYDAVLPVRVRTYNIHIISGQPDTGLPLASSAQYLATAAWSRRTRS